MDYEEKYKKTLERARKIHNETEFDYEKGMMEEIFPELQENKEEKIRKDLIEWIEEFPDSIWRGHYKKDILAWLEKHKPVEHLELKAGHWYICYRAYCCRADHLTVREGERFMCEKDGVVKGFVIKDAEKYFKECNAPAPYEDEQKPKWTADDERHENTIIRAIHGAGNITPIDGELAEKWLKSLKQRME